MEIFKELPIELKLKILSFDWNVKFFKGKYNLLPKESFILLKPVFEKKICILKTITLSGSDFYFEFRFDTHPELGLCFDLGFNKAGTLEICYVNMKERWIQKRTLFDKDIKVITDIY